MAVDARTLSLIHIYSTVAKGPRYLELAEGYVLELGLDEGNEIIGYKFLKVGPYLEEIKKGADPVEAFKKHTACLLYTSRCV